MNDDLKNFTTEQLKIEIETRKVNEEHQKIFDSLPNPIGLWEITTEGDCEGKSTKHIAIEYGHIAELALRYAGYTYDLHFKQINEMQNLNPKRKDYGSFNLGGGYDINKLPRYLVNDWLGEGYQVNLHNDSSGQIKIMRRKKD